MNTNDKSDEGEKPRAIRIDDGYDVDFWTRVLGVSDGELREMVQEYGDMDMVIRRMVNRAV